MAQVRKFKTNTGVSIFVPNRPDPIRVNAGEPYETSDESEIETLEASHEVVEVQSKKEAEKNDSGEQQRK